MRRESVFVSIVVLAALLGAGLTACDDKPVAGPGPHGRKALKHARLVANDARASAKEIIASGGAVDIKGWGDRTLISYEVRDFESGEGATQDAWRLYDQHSHRVADGRWPGEFPDIGVRSTADGFVLRYGTPDARWVLVDHDGHVSELPVSDGEGATRSGDVYLGLGAVYRVGTDGAPGRIVQLSRRLHKRVTVAADGSVWVLDNGPDASVQWSVDGRAPWHTERVPIPARARGSLLESVGKRVYLVAVSARGRYGTVDSLWERPTGPTDNWTLVADGFEELTANARLAPTDGKLVLADIDWKAPTAYVQDGHRFRPVPLLPGKGQAHEEVVGVVRNAVYLKPGETYNLKVSRDNGKNWEYVPR